MALEIIVPETKPATEWVRGRARQKLTPRTAHARAQLEFASALLAWAKNTGLGNVGIEWDFRVTPPGEATRPLVPDVAYLSFARLSQEDQESTEVPRCAPNAAIEILSPGELRADIEDKIAVYLAAGGDVVVEVDPRRGVVRAHDSAGTRSWRRGESFEHRSLQGFSLIVDTLFSQRRR